MDSFFRILSLMLLAMFLAFSRLSQADDAYLDKIENTPDFMQTSRAELAKGGANYCAPVAASNGLLWLAEHGYPKLLSSAGKGREQDQFDLIVVLGSKQFMDTNPRGGTGANQILVGLAKYIKSAGYTYRSLRYQGWRRHEAIFGTDATIPEVNWFLDQIHGESIVLFNIGWYSKVGADYLRHGGHWVTFVGYRRENNSELLSLFIHDPSPRSGSSPHSENVTWTVIEKGRLLGDELSLPRSATGYLLLGGELRPRRGYVGILDGVVSLKIEPMSSGG